MGRLIMKVNRTHYAEFETCIICGGSKKKLSKFCVHCGNIIMHLRTEYKKNIKEINLIIKAKEVIKIETINNKPITLVKSVFY
jgi:hypothetical protein